MLARTETFRHAKTPPSGISDTYIGPFNSVGTGETFSTSVTVPSGTEAILVLVGGKTHGSEGSNFAFVPAGCTYNGVQLTTIHQIQTAGGTTSKATTGILGLRNPASGANTLALEVDDTSNSGMRSWTIHVYALTNVKATGNFWGTAVGTTESVVDSVTSIHILTTAPGSLILGIATANSGAGANGTPDMDITSTDSIANVGSGQSLVYWVVGRIEDPDDDAEYHFWVTWNNDALRSVAVVEILA